MADYFTWGVSQWGTASATWVSPLVTSGAAAAVTSAAVTDRALIETSGTAGAVSALAAQSGYTKYVAPDGTGIYVSATTARVYDRLPGCFRDADVTAYGNGSQFPLLRWIASLVDQAGEIEALIDRFSSLTSSALTDPTLADAPWLSWLGQLVGVTVSNPPGDVAAARLLIANAITGTPRGSKGSIAAAVAPLLTGTQTVTVNDHYGGDPWQIQVDTLASETPANLVATGFQWGVSQWGDANATWEPVGTDPLVIYLEEQQLVPAGYVIVHTTS